MALVTSSNSDWLVVLFTSVAIGQSNYFSFDFTTLNWKLLSSINFQAFSLEETRHVVIRRRPLSDDNSRTI